ncbi:MAG: response regulator transcription factor [Ignavibacteria bacterium]|jgi:DNA-binding LytR/AlgR family response regulator|nr:response regulator transcription factor [Ignavibacteria bacterium]MCU7504361.1 response regulator transcription factor [Ignavibacteria bacterium]MCU7517584.1 response regulator transcription factor [Ignavibacteria bacterium]
MRILIIEDEAPASRRLKKLLSELEPAAEIEGSLESIEASVDWLRKNPPPDIIFMDIQLSDGLSFEIFNNVNVDSPVVFTTAYDEYAIQAFRVNSIDYLLKPIDTSSLSASIEKYKKIRNVYSVQYRANEIADLLKSISPSHPVYKSRFLIKSGSSMLVIPASEIAFFYVDNKITYIVCRNGKRHLTGHSLDELEELLNPQYFFRANRRFIIHIDIIESVSPIFGGKLKLRLLQKTDEEIVISRERASAFREWLDQ